jgi:hypothetical protein
MIPGAIAIVFGVDSSSLRLPTFDSLSAWHLVYLLIVVVAGLLFLQWRLRKTKMHQLLADRFMQILMHRNLTTAQNRVVDIFFRELTDSVQSEILLSPKAFGIYLKQYLARHPEVAPSDKVQIFDKLLLNGAEPVHIESVANLRLGELCALDVGRSSHMTTVLKIHENFVLLSSKARFSFMPPVDAKLYAYRPHLGGFLIPGSITKINNNSLIFNHEGPIDFKGDQHLMSVISIPLKLESWPHPDLEAFVTSESPTATETTPYSGTTERISDRAFLVTFSTPPQPKLLKSQEFWEITLDLPEKPLVCRVKMSPYKIPENFLLRPVDLDSAERERLYNFVTKHDPQREHF